MRNREAARYARWAATAAALVAAGVAGVYARRAWRAERLRRAEPAAMPATMERQSAQFSFSKVEQDKTLFTIRASQATQFKDQDRALLVDVWITIYGQSGNRNDNIHTHECSYQPQTGNARCEGAVEMDIEDAKPAPGQPAAKALELQTSDITFNRDTGEAETSAPVEFTFPEGSGRGVGLSYSSRDSVVRIARDVEFKLPPSERTGGLPVSATGSSVEFRRNDQSAVLAGPATVRQGSRVLTADAISAQFDSQNRVSNVTAEGHPRIRSSENGADISVSASRLEALMNPAGWIDHIVADGNISAKRRSTGIVDHFAAAHVEFTMLPGRNLLRDMVATGGVTANSQQNGNSSRLKTAALHLTFSPGRAAGPSAKAALDGGIGGQQIESAETLAPAEAVSMAGDERTTLRAVRLTAVAGSGGRIKRMLGRGGVDILREKPGAAPQNISSAEMAVTFASGGQWDAVEESGNVSFQQADRQARAQHATIVRATDTIRLEGSPVISDSTGRTSAASVMINQKSGEVQATGRVNSIYTLQAGKEASGLGSGPAHISADELSGSISSGHAAYIGHARLWQGESVLEADRIDLWRDGQKMRAAGNVVALFPQERGTFPGLPSKPSGGSHPSAGPTLWSVRAPLLTFYNAEGRARLEGGVVASSDQGSLESRTLDVYLSPPAAPPKEPAPAPSAQPEIAAGRQLDRVVAAGRVVVRQGGRRAVAERAEYTAADGKFVLSGGQPTIVDASNDTATGHSLTFFVASDTILIDSQEGSRTLTKHRVEK